MLGWLEWWWLWGIYSPQPLIQPLGQAAVDGRTEQSGASPDSVRWRTGLSGAPIDSSLPQRLNWWLGAINTPQPPPLQQSKHSLLLIQYKSKVQHSKTQIKATDSIKVSNSILVFRTYERIICVSLLLLFAWLGFLFFLTSYSQAL